MRYAKVSQVRRHLRTKQDQWASRITRFTVEDIPSLGTIEIPFSSPLTILSGANGAGKTTLLRALWATLDPSSAAPIVGTDSRLSAGRASLSLVVGAKAQDINATFPLQQESGNELDGLEVMHIDPANEAQELRDLYLTFENLEELTNGLSAREMKPEELSEISYVTAREYRSMRLYEVEVGSDKVAPFFEVTYGNDSYDSRTMGTGEICALQTWWKLSRAAEGSIILMEEPEAFLSHICQNNLRDHIFAKIVDKKLVAIISSHSAPFVTAAPKESVAFLSRGVQGLEVVSSPVPPIVLKSVGVESPIIAVLFVEDNIGRLALKATLDKMDPSIARQIQVEIVHGDGNIVSILKLSKSFRGSLKFIGALDGDMGESVPSEVRDQIFLLPGSEPLEKELRSLIENDFASVDTALGVANLRAIVDGLQGNEHHDWFSQLAVETGIGYDQLFLIMFRMWMEIAAKGAEVERSYGRLLQLLGRE